MAAFCLEVAARLFDRLYVTQGADLPSWTLAVRDALKVYAPWMLAGAVTLIAGLLAWQRSSRLSAFCVVASALGLVLLSAAVLSLSLPIMKCGWSWPEWADAAPSLRCQE